MGVVDARRDEGQVGCALGCGGSWVERAHYVKHVYAERSHLFLGPVVVDRCPELNGWVRKIEPGGHDADDGVGLGVQIDRPVLDVGFTAVAALTQSPTEQYPCAAHRAVNTL